MKTIEDVISYLNGKGVSNVMTVRMRRLCKKLGSLSNLFSVDSVEVEKAYNSLTPDGKHGLGKTFWEVFKMAKGYFNGFYVDQEDLERKPKEEKRQDNVNVSLMRMYSYAEMKAIVDMMEYCNIERINFMEVASFLDNVRLRQRKPDDGKSEDPSQGGSENAKQK